MESKWVKTAAFAGRKTKVYVDATRHLQENGVEVVNWSGSQKNPPAILLLDKEVAADPPKKVHTAESLGIPVVDVEWVLACIEIGHCVDYKGFYLTKEKKKVVTTSASTTESDPDLTMVFGDTPVKAVTKVSPGPKKAKAKSKRRQLVVDSDDDSDDYSARCTAANSSLRSLDVPIKGSPVVTQKTAAEIHRKRSSSSGSSRESLSHANPSDSTAVRKFQKASPLDVPWWERSTPVMSKPAWCDPSAKKESKCKAPCASAKAKIPAAKTTPAPPTRPTAITPHPNASKRTRSETPGACPTSPTRGSSSPPSRLSTPVKEDRLDRSTRAREDRQRRNSIGATPTSRRPLRQPAFPVAGTPRMSVTNSSKPTSQRTKSTPAPPASTKPNLVDRAAEKRGGGREYDRPWATNTKKARDDEKKDVDPIMKILKEHEATKNLPSDLVAGIRNEIYEPAALKEGGITFDDVQGLEEAKKTLHRSVILPRLNPKLFQGLRKPCKGLLLFGPPGNGKTMLAKAVAAQCNLTFFNISASALTSKMVGDGEKNVKALFACARALAPSFVFLDEIDSLLQSRSSGGGEHEASRRVKTEFLVQLDGAGASNDQVLVMAATNRPMDLDDAVLRRLEKRVYVPLPSREVRLSYCERTLKHDENLNLAFTESTWQEIAESTDGYSFCDLANLCRELALAPLDDCSNLLSADIADLRPIDENDVKRQVQKIRRSVSLDMVAKLEAWNKLYGSQKDDS